jgi:plastocyanin
MKKGILSIVVIAISMLVNTSFAQEAKTIHLDQTKGEFTIQSLTLQAGTYVFDIENKDVDHEVGFVLAPKGKTDQEHHIKEAYVTETVKLGKVSSSNEVVLTPGEYVYFCPMNPTEQYPLTVK